MPKILMCDPPSGWKYGFPKPMPAGLVEGGEKDWLIANGYPAKMAEDMRYCRYWETEIDDASIG